MEGSPNLASRIDHLFYYSPYHFLRKISRNYQFENYILSEFEKNNKSVVLAEGESFEFYFKKLAWDSDFFQIPMFRLFTILFESQNFNLLKKSIQLFLKQYFDTEEKKYCFIAIPSEDILLVQALCANGFRLVETRVNCYCDNLQKLDNERFAVKEAQKDDIETLRKIAAQSPNIYDKYHADVFFSEEMAANYLAIYAENCLKGFADIVFVPDEPKLPLASFMAANYEKIDEENRAGRIILSACLPENQGWHYKLFSEATYHFKDMGMQYALMTTQITNRAVIRNWEKLGYKFGNTTHILVYST